MSFDLFLNFGNLIFGDFFNFILCDKNYKRIRILMKDVEKDIGITMYYHGIILFIYYTRII